MAGRAVLELYHADPDGDVLPGQAITVTRPDGSPLGVALYSQPTGGSPVTTPITNSVGTRLLYADCAGLETADATFRVVVSYADAPGSDFADAFYPDPADLFVDGMARDRSLGGFLTTGGLSATISDPATYALSLRNTDPTTSKSFRVTNAEGTKDFFWVGRVNGNDIVSINLLNDAMPETTTFHVYKVSDTSYVMADFGFEQTGAGHDSGALRAHARTTGTSTIRAGEFQTIRNVTTTPGGTWGIEIGVHSRTLGTDYTYNLGAYIGSSSVGWLSGTGVRNGCGVLVTGADGWTYGYRYDDTNNTPLWYVNQSGITWGKGNNPLTNGVHDLGTTDGTLSWRSVNSYWLMLKQDNAPVAVAGTNKIWASIADEQVYIQNAAGASRAVTGGSQSVLAQPFSSTTASASYGTITGGTVSLTGGTATTGGNLLAICTLCVSNSAAGNAMYLALALDGAAEVGEVVTIEPVLNAQVTQTVSWKFTGVSAGTHTVRARWRTSAGTSTAYSGQLLVIEEAH